MALPPRQQAFVDAYLVEPNATKAAEKAGYSAKTANQQGSRLLANVGVRKALETANAKRAAKVEVTVEEVLRELKRLALADIGDAFDADGRLKPLADMAPDVRRCIASVETEELFGTDKDGQPVLRGYLRKVKTWDKKGSLDSLAKHLGMFIEKHEHSGNVTIIVEQPYAEPRK